MIVSNTEPFVIATAVMAPKTIVRIEILILCFCIHHSCDVAIEVCYFR